MGVTINSALPIKLPSTQAAKSYAGKAEAITQGDLNKTMLPMRKKEKMRRKILLHRVPSIIIPSLP